MSSRVKSRSLQQFLSVLTAAAFTFSALYFVAGVTGHHDRFLWVGLILLVLGVACAGAWHFARRNHAAIAAQLTSYSVLFACATIIVALPQLETTVLAGSFMAFGVAFPHLRGPQFKLLLVVNFLVSC